MSATGVSRSVFVALVGLIAIVFCTSIPTRAQVAGGTILGTVSDPTGAVIANAEIAIKERATGVVHTITSNSAGFYTVPNLSPGQYDLRISAAGFSVGTASGVTLTVPSARDSASFAITRICCEVKSPNGTVAVAIQ